MSEKVLNNRKGIKISWRGLLAIAIFLLPFWMLVVWFFLPGRKLLIAIVDKTVVEHPGQEHLSLHWVLNQEKFLKNNTDRYEPDKDYFGFFPLEDEKYKLKGLERFDSTQLEKLSVDADAAYITDAYGVFRNEWFKQGNIQDRSGIVYGGMSKQDLYFLELMKQKENSLLLSLTLSALQQILPSEKNLNKVLVSNGQAGLVDTLNLLIPPSIRKYPDGSLKIIKERITINGPLKMEE